MSGSCNFDSDESVQALAQCIDSCKSIKFFDIAGQTGARKVQVAHTPGEKIEVFAKVIRKVKIRTCLLCVKEVEQTDTDILYTMATSHR